MVAQIVVPLFVPATRPERLAKAAQSGADALILDLEDAVAPADKAAAREGLATLTLPDLPVILRINAAGTEWHEADLAMAARLDLAAVMLPKAEDAATLGRVHSATGKPTLALVETAVGLSQLAAIASAPGLSRLVFGSVDFSADIGCAHEPEPLLFARSQIVLASRLAGLAAPIDGVTLAFSDDAAAEEDARRAAALGFGGKLCIHPRQIAPVLCGFAPSPEETEWARKVIDAAGADAVAIEGMMIDAPVRRRASQILHRAALCDRENADV